MGWLDKAIALVSPESAYRREAWRKAYEEIRNYDAGANDHLNAGWRVVNATAEQTDSVYRETIRARARDLERNSDIQESIVGAFERNVVGNGFKLQAKTTDEELNETIEKLWKEWCKPRNCDVTAQQSFNEMCRMSVRRKKVDGGIFIIKRYTRGGIVPFTLQLREVDDLDTMQQSRSGRIINGIEYNEFNRPIAYYFKNYDIHGFYSGKSDRIEADDVIFLWNKKRPSQIREMSEMSPTISRIRDTNSYMEAVSVKERVAACLSVFIKRQDPTTGGIGRQGRSGTTAAGYEGKTLSPGMIMELNPGDDVVAVNPPAQGASAADFVRLQQRLTGSGQGISYEATARDMSQVNYSSARQGLLEDFKTYQIEQQYLIDHMLSEIYETFLISAVLSGAISIKDFWSNKNEYLNHEWVSPGMKWIDPIKEANANKVSLETNQTTLAEIAASAGHDWKEVVDQRAREIDYMKKKGVIEDDEG
ncbi:phage portal protein [Domibacillus antri]|uniref:Phage portal protein n=1 Tax=Domibacillus antri TaxID=1714264 RepID=A0A1Q8Q252_9BACI|nr:phage portal protein [Domibacillus antri]OLN21410.1 phage portal protein [Domibacillus antri]